jgi:hypothetical protein
MREVRDTFLKFLSDNLPNTIPVHAVRRDSKNPSGDKLQMNAVNIEFLSVKLRVTVGCQLCSIDVVADDELAALESVKQVWILLSSAFYTPQLNYSNPSAPVPTGTNVMWKPSNVEFIPVPSDFYFHYTCALKLDFNPLTT